MSKSNQVEAFFALRDEHGYVSSDQLKDYDMTMILQHLHLLPYMSEQGKFLGKYFVGRNPELRTPEQAKACWIKCPK